MTGKHHHDVLVQRNELGPHLLTVVLNGAVGVSTTQAVRILTGDGATVHMHVAVGGHNDLVVGMRCHHLICPGQHLVAGSKVKVDEHPLGVANGKLVVGVDNRALLVQTAVLAGKLAHVDLVLGEILVDTLPSKLVGSAVMVMVAVDHGIGNLAVELRDRIKSNLPLLGGVIVGHVAHTGHVLNVFAFNIVCDPLVKRSNVSGTALFGLPLGHVLNITHNCKGVSGVEILTADGLHLLLGQPILAEDEVGAFAALIHNGTAVGGKLPVCQSVGVVVIGAVLVVALDLCGRALIVKERNATDLALEHTGIGQIIAVIGTDHILQLGHVFGDITQLKAAVVGLNEFTVQIAGHAVLFRLDHNGNMCPFTGSDDRIAEVELTCLADAFSVGELSPRDIRIDHLRGAGVAVLLVIVFRGHIQIGHAFKAVEITNDGHFITDLVLKPAVGLNVDPRLDGAGRICQRAVHIVPFVAVGKVEALLGRCRKHGQHSHHRQKHTNGQKNCKNLFHLFSPFSFGAIHPIPDKFSTRLLTKQYFCCIIFSKKLTFGRNLP